MTGMVIGAYGPWKPTGLCRLRKSWFNKMVLQEHITSEWCNLAPGSEPYDNDDPAHPPLFKWADAKANTFSDSITKSMFNRPGG